MKSLAIAAAMLMLVVGSAGAGDEHQGTKINGLADNGVKYNALGPNGTHVNGLSDNGIHANSIFVSAQDLAILPVNSIGSSELGDDARNDLIGSVELIGVELPH